MSKRSCRRAYQKYRERQRLQREEDRRAIEDLEERLRALELERTELVQRVDVLQKVLLAGSGVRVSVRVTVRLMFKSSARGVDTTRKHCRQHPSVPNRQLCMRMALLEARHAAMKAA